MAFQQPVARPAAPVRQLSEQQQQQQQPAPASTARKRLLEESQEWILFSPAVGEQQSNTSTTLRTATQPSTYGSLETHALSRPRPDGDFDAGLDDNGDDNDDDAAAAAAELDSLDDGLHAFHHPFSTSSAPPPLDVSGGSVLPRHDGFGAFPSSAGLQQQLWQFERHNPQRRKLTHRRSSVQRQLDAIEDGQADIEDERAARIEKWRLDQGHAVLEEIEKETKRQRRRMSRMGAGVGGAAQLASQIPDAAIDATQQTPLRHSPAATTQPIAVGNIPAQPSESFWQRITRRVMRDLIGLDDSTLSVIFGESLVEDPSPTPRQTSPLAAAASKESRVTFQDSGHSWDVKLLNRIARELGVLVHCLSSHDGAFSTYLHRHEELDYAGLGPPPRDATVHRQHPSLRKRRKQQQNNPQTTTAMPTATQFQDSLFVPTLGPTPLSPSDAPDSSLWGIEEEEQQQPTEEADRQQREYRERDIDLRAIFAYLHDHLLGGGSAAHPASNLDASTTDDTNPLLPASWATSSQQQRQQQQQQQQTQPQTQFNSPFHSQRRAEMIRRQHPLVSHAAQQSSRRRHHESLLLRKQLSHSQRQRVGSGTAAGGSSCASQSTRRSRHSRSAASSRHFWDLSGSVGSVGSAAVVSSAMGGWAEA